MLLGKFTPSLASLIQPVTLFKPHTTSPSECPPQSSSTEVSTCTQENGEVHINVDDLQVADNNEYHTKAAKLIQKSLGRTNELDMFDKLRAVMKAKMHKRQKPARYEQQQYQALSAKLNTQLIAVKCDLKRQGITRRNFIRNMELFPIKRVILNMDPSVKRLTIQRSFVTSGTLVLPCS